MSADDPVPPRCRARYRAWAVSTYGGMRVMRESRCFLAEGHEGTHAAAVLRVVQPPGEAGSTRPMRAHVRSFKDTEATA